MLIQIHEIQQVANEVMNMLHEEEIAVINEFYDAVSAKDIEKIDELFKVVLFDVEDHFKTEEDINKYLLSIYIILPYFLRSLLMPKTMSLCSMHDRPLFNAVIAA